MRHHLKSDGQEFKDIIQTSTSDLQEFNGDEKSVHGSNAKKGHVWWALLLFFSSKLPDKVLLHLLIVILTSMSRIMKLKLHEARRLGKISGSMFDREEGADRQRLFLKDQRKQRRWAQSHISFNLPVLQPFMSYSISQADFEISQTGQTDPGEGRKWKSLQDGARLCQAKGSCDHLRQWQQKFEF